MCVCVYSLALLSRVVGKDAEAHFVESSVTEVGVVVARLGVERARREELVARLQLHQWLVPARARAQRITSHRSVCACAQWLNET